jgi:hypothetical protein
VSDTRQSSLQRLATSSIQFSIQIAPLPSWYLQFFLNYCLLHVLNTLETTVHRDPHHLEPGPARQWLDLQKKRPTPDCIGLSAEQLPQADCFPLVLRLGELIRFAFNAATTSTVEMVRAVGLKFLLAIIDLFGPRSDPDFPEFSLLEQYQAQINACISLAFTSSDGSAVPFHVMPEVQVLATKVCAHYIAGGIGADIASVGRATRILSGLLERCNDAEAFSVGKERCPVAFIWMRLAVQTAYADILLRATREQTQTRKLANYPAEIVRQHYAQLLQNWLVLLQDFNMLKLAPYLLTDVDENRAVESSERVFSRSPLNNGGTIVLDYPAFFRNQLLNHYSHSWSIVVGALSAVMEEAPQLFRSHPDRSRLFFDVLGQCAESLMLWTSMDFASGLLKSDQPAASLGMIRTLFGGSVAGKDLTSWLEPDAIVEMLQIMNRVILKEQFVLSRSAVKDGTSGQIITAVPQLLGCVLAFVERFIREHYRSFIPEDAAQQLPSVLRELWKIIFDALECFSRNKPKGTLNDQYLYVWCNTKLFYCNFRWESGICIQC